MALSAGSVEYTNCISAKDQDTALSTSVLNMTQNNL